MEFLYFTLFYTVLHTTWQATSTVYKQVTDKGETRTEKKKKNSIT